MRGFLAHDAKIVHGVCPTCHKQYSFYEHTICPKCGVKLETLMAKDNQAMAIGEITFYPAIGQEQEGRDAKITRRRPSGLMPTYRAKMFSFADENGNLEDPHLEFHNLKKGAMVEIVMINHQQIFNSYESKKFNETRLEIMHFIYEGYGDSVTILRGPKKASAESSYKVDGNGNPVAPTAAPVASENVMTPEQMLAKAQALIQQAEALEQTTAPAQPSNNASEAAASMDIPFPE